VGYIKKTRMAAAMQMLMNNTLAIVHRHFIAGKRHHFGAQLKMKRIKRGLF